MITNRIASRWIGMVVGVMLLVALAAPMVAQDKKEDRLSGRVHMVNKETSTITIRTSGNTQRYVVYSASTKFTLGNKDGSLDEVKDGVRLICLGKYDDKARLVASRIEVRPGR